ncbi:MAG: diaminopimelate decarboxylase [Myxococcota bacterium]|jgi:diaminopimelate decarboxylase|nr:diaminopimelate decarboxylase [Myxococcota bacterium]
MNFLSPEQIQSLRAEYGTPLYAYDQRSLEEAAREVLAFPSAYGLTARYAMKALPTASIVRLFSDMGLHIDASSGFEAQRAMLAGVPGEHIQISAQELPQDLKGLVDQGVRFNACSLGQLEAYARLFPGGEVSVRINPGLGTGHNNRTNTGGPASSFGIWHEHLDRVRAIQEETGVRITRMHTHIGSGGDPEAWKHCALLSLAVAAQMPEVTTLNLGGGFKIARMPGEVTANLEEIGNALLDEFRDFERQHGRALHLEIEPGTYLVARAGAIISNVTDVVDTGSEGYTFAKVDTGMTEFLRPNLYGAQHPIDLFPRDADANREEVDVLVAGHCCESGDMMTPEPGDPEGLAPRRLPRPVPGDSLVIGGAGAYCSGLAASNYNSFPQAPEVLIGLDGQPRLIRKRQSLDQILCNEIDD